MFIEKFDTVSKLLINNSGIVVKILEAGGGIWTLAVFGTGCIFDFCKADEATCFWRGC